MAKENSIPKEILIAASASEQIKQRESSIAIQDAEETQSKQQAATVLAALGGTTVSGSSTATNDLQNQVLTKLLQSLEYDLGKKQAKQEEEEESLRRLIKARNEGVKVEKERRELTQRICDHRKEDGRTRICGQRISNGTVSLMCNLCYAEFSASTVPPHLMPNGDFIGG